MSEIVSIQIGLGGNKMGKAFWKMLSHEHDIRNDVNKQVLPSLPNGSVERKDHVYFREVSKDYHYEQRNILTDLAKLDTDYCENGLIPGDKFSDEFISSNFIFGNEDKLANHVFAEGKYTKGPDDLIDKVLNSIRKETEHCDSLQGFQFSHGLGGGTGGGFGSLLISHLRDLYPDRTLISFPIFPSPLVSDIVIEPYNAILSLPSLIQDLDGCFCIDNGSLYNILRYRFRNTTPSFNDLNYVASMAMSGVTASFRFEGQKNSNLEKMCSFLSRDLSSFPNLHFFSIGIAPLQSTMRWKLNSRVEFVTHQLFDIDRHWEDSSSSSKMKIHNVLTNTDFQNTGIFLKSYILHRSEHLKNSDFQKVRKIIDEKFFSKMKKKKLKILEMEGVKNGMLCVGTPMKTSFVSGCHIFHSTSIREMFSDLMKRFREIFYYKTTDGTRRMPFVHWYQRHGMEESEFVEAEETVQSLIDEYQRVEDGMLRIYEQKEGIRTRRKHFEMAFEEDDERNRLKWIFSTFYNSQRWWQIRIGGSKRWKVLKILF